MKAFDQLEVLPSAHESVRALPDASSSRRVLAPPSDSAFAPHQRSCSIGPCTTQPASPRGERSKHAVNTKQEGHNITPARNLTQGRRLRKHVRQRQAPNQARPPIATALASGLVPKAVAANTPEVKTSPGPPPANQGNSTVLDPDDTPSNPAVLRFPAGVLAAPTHP